MSLKQLRHIEVVLRVDKINSVPNKYTVVRVMFRTPIWDK